MEGLELSAKTKIESGASLVHGHQVPLFFQLHAQTAQGSRMNFTFEDIVHEGATKLCMASCVLGRRRPLDLV